MSVISSSNSVSSRVRCLADEEADHAMLQDLQLAAELGKTLLERNKELENCIKVHQCTIEDQAQEIEYMKKQTAALKEANESRLKIYEQLEVSIQDLERANDRLAHENANDKRTIKSQTANIETLETRADDLQKKYDELNSKYEALIRQQVKQQLDFSQFESSPTAFLRDDSTTQNAISPRRLSFDRDSLLHNTINTNTNQEDITELLEQLQDARSQRAREQKKMSELTERLNAIVQENSLLEEQLCEWKSKAEYIKNLQDEISTLHEVRQGELCGRCQRNLDTSKQDQLSAMYDQSYEEEDEMSLADSLAAEGIPNPDPSLKGFILKEDPDVKSENPYRVLVDKYEALLKLQTQKQAQIRKQNSANPSFLSLQEELQMSGEFSSMGHAENDASCNNNSRPNSSQQTSAKKPLTGVCTPTDFSEAETSESGFSDETSNKATQTESARPGSLLCSIADGEDCRFSIYDDCSNFRSRFQKTPEYRQLFSEIFKVLKRAAAAKDEGESLPLLDESANSTPKQQENRPVSVSMYSEDAASEATTFDDDGSVASMAVSSVASEPVFRVNSPVIAGRRDDKKNTHHSTPDKPHQIRPLQNNTRRQPLEYLSIQVRRKAAKKHSRRSNTDTPSTPDVVPSINPRITHNSGARGSLSRRRYRHQPEFSEGFWNGSTTHFYARSKNRFSQGSSSGLDDSRNSNDSFKASTASEDIAKLKRLEMSYAEVLRSGNKKPQRQRKY